MPSVAANGIRIEYESHGDPARPAIVLIMGLGMQLVAWPDELIDGLVARRFRVLRFDNRDAGLSTQFDDHPVGPLMSVFMRWSFGWPVAAPYTLDDMANDTIGLFDALGIERAHVVGASMGGMIGQLLAARHRGRVRSLTSMMSTTGARRLPHARLDAFLALVKRPDPEASLDALVDHFVHLFRVIGSPGYETPLPLLQERLRRGLARAFRPMGTLRQMIAILASGDLSMLLPQVTAPTLVIHGDADPLVPVAHGEDTAAKIPGAQLKVIQGMGHDLPPALVPELIELIASHCAAADAIVPAQAGA
ncbi:MAG: alpha/beta fold hydrolase [Gemmatimonadota bacterium]